MSAYEEGYNAYHDMICINDNPYVLESFSYDLWIKGWRDACDDYGIG